MANCTKCGAELKPGAAFCGSCGTPVAAGSGAPPASPASAPSAAPGGGATPAAAGSGMTSNVAGALTYVLGFITGIIFLVIEPYKNDKFVRFHAFQSIFFNAGLIAFWIVWSILAAILGTLTFGVLGLVMALIGMVIALVVFGFWIFLMYKAYNNEQFMIPFIGELAKKQVGV
jgi:uncharacterized membrane protein